MGGQNQEKRRAAIESEQRDILVTSASIDDGAKKTLDSKHIYTYDGREMTDYDDVAM